MHRRLIFGGIAFMALGIPWVWEHLTFESPKAGSQSTSPASVVPSFQSHAPTAIDPPTYSVVVPGWVVDEQEGRVSGVTVEAWRIPPGRARRCDVPSDVSARAVSDPSGEFTLLLAEDALYCIAGKHRDWQDVETQIVSTGADAPEAVVIRAPPALRVWRERP